jgi:hypothetical protein
LKYGGEKALTKTAPDDNALKCQLTVEESKKLAEDNAIAVCDVQANIELKSKLEIPQIKTGIKPKINVLEKIVPELYNLEERAKSEKPVKIVLDLDLFQMEKV